MSSSSLLMHFANSSFSSCPSLYSSSFFFPSPLFSHNNNNTISSCKKNKASIFNMMMNMGTSSSSFSSSSLGFFSNSPSPSPTNQSYKKKSFFTAPPPPPPGVAYAAAASSVKDNNTLHDFTVKDIDGKDVSLSKFKGKVLLVVNVASRCGLTSSNYSELTDLYNKYKAQGLEILAFPCNQFGGQEPGTNQEIKQFACTRYKAEFPIFDKVDVNGSNTAPVYQFLKTSTGGFLGDVIKWNFEKFLVDKNGKVVERYNPTTSLLQIEKDIKRLLGA